MGKIETSIFIKAHPVAKHAEKIKLYSHFVGYFEICIFLKDEPNE